MSIVLGFIIFTILVYFVQSKYKLYLVGRKLPGPWTFPLVGNVEMIRKLKPEYLFAIINEQRQKYRQSFRFWLGPQLWVFLHSPEETRDALNDSTLRKADTFQQLDVLIGNGLLISHGKYWASHRRALGPAFHPNVLHSFTEVISQHANELVRILNYETNGVPVEVTDYLFPCILDAICATSMGKNLNSQNEPNGVYTKAFHTTSELLFNRMVNPLLSFDFIYKRTKAYPRLCQSLEIIHNLMESVIEERAIHLKHESTIPLGHDIDDSHRKRRTLLDILLLADVDGRPLTTREVRDEVNTFVFAGVDTTTASMCFVLYALAKYPTMQDRVFQEIQSVVNGNETIGFNEVNRMEYLDMFIKECLRLYTIVPLTGRQTTCDTKIGNITYCKGTTLWINMYGLAHDEEFFPNPMQFYPERFTKENQQKLPSFSYIPFSGGPHVCIGRKYSLLIMKVLTMKIIQNLRISLRDPDEDLILMAQMVLKSLHGINLVFERR